MHFVIYNFVLVQLTPNEQYEQIMGGFYWGVVPNTQNATLERTG